MYKAAAALLRGSERERKREREREREREILAGDRDLCLSSHDLGILSPIQDFRMKDGEFIEDPLWHRIHPSEIWERPSQGRIGPSRLDGFHLKPEGIISLEMESTGVLVLFFFSDQS